MCAECGTFSEDDAEGWRAYTAGGKGTRPLGGLGDVTSPIPGHTPRLKDRKGCGREQKQQSGDGVEQGDTFRTAPRSALGPAATSAMD